MDFEALLAQRREGLNTEQTRKMEEEAAEQRAREAAAIDGFDAAARRVLEGLYDQATNWEYHVEHRYGKAFVDASAEIAGESWKFSTPQSIGANGLAVQSPRVSPENEKTRLGPWNVETLAGFLDIGLAWQKKRGEYLEHRQALNIETIQRRAAQQAAYDVATARSAAFQEEIDRAVAAAEDALWTWPAGKGLALCSWRWHAIAEDGVAVQQEGWTLQDSIPSDGWFTLKPTVWESRERRVFVSPGCLPMAEAFTFWATADLPHELKETLTLELPYTKTHVWNPATETMDSMWAAVGEHEAWDFVKIEIGVQPLGWIRDLMDAGLPAQGRTTRAVRRGER